MPMLVLCICYGSDLEEYFAHVGDGRSDRLIDVRAGVSESQFTTAEKSGKNSVRVLKAAAPRTSNFP